MAYELPKLLRFSLRKNATALECAAVNAIFGYHATIVNKKHDSAPVVVLLSDGEANVPESNIRRLCGEATRLG
jgi:hypothetical protein